MVMFEGIFLTFLGLLLLLLLLLSQVPRRRARRKLAFAKGRTRWFY